MRRKSLLETIFKALSALALCARIAFFALQKTKSLSLSLGILLVPFLNASQTQLRRRQNHRTRSG